MDSIPLLIVGFGIAGANLALEAIDRDIDFRVADNPSLSRSSRVAAGLFNPVVFRKITEGWEASASLELAKTRYAEAERRLQSTFYHPIGMWRIHGSADEYKTWQEKRNCNSVGRFLGPSVPAEMSTYIKAPFGISEVPDAGFIKTETFLNAMRDALHAQNRLIPQHLDPIALIPTNQGWSWNGMHFNHVVFAEGYLHKAQEASKPLLNPAKGEVLQIHAPELPQRIINGKVYMVPLGDGCFKVGSTYAWQQSDALPTMEKRAEIILALQSMISCQFEIHLQDAGIRPTVPDRRPILGPIPGKPEQYLFNGLGTKGVLLAPLLAKRFFDYLLHNTPIPAELHIARFYGA